MKKIEAIIRTSKLEDVTEGLEAIGVKFFTFFEVKGHGNEKPSEITYRGVPYDSGYIPRTKIELVVEDNKLQQVVSVVSENARTGKIGDGKIIVTDVEGFFRVRTGEEGQEAL
jgi:nitrogen regulatory protein P-II 1